MVIYLLVAIAVAQTALFVFAYCNYAKCRKKLEEIYDKHMN
jgi:hypothetical protein